MFNFVIKNLKKFLIKDWQNSLIIGVIFFLAVALRIWFVSGNNIMFWFDQARDAVVATSIIKNNDLKIQGPSASGTGDAVYHGVLYYYLIAPFYFFGGGDPQILAYGLAIFSSLSVLVVYFMVKDIFKKEEVALLSAFLVAFSALGVQEGVWLSNPVILVLSITLFFWMFWKVFFQNQKKYIYWLLFFLGICNQAAVFTVLLWAPLLVAYFYRANQEKTIFIFSIQKYFLGGVIYLGTISTIILTEALLIKRGVLTLNILNKTGEHFIGVYQMLTGIILFYFNFFSNVLTPNYFLLFFILLGGLITLSFFKLEIKKRFYFLLVISYPLWLLTWHFRTSPHLFIGLNIFVLILLAVGFLKLKKLFKSNIFFLLVVSGFAVLNLWSLKTARFNRTHLFVIQRGAVLAEQISLIAKTYSLANGEQFSISTLSAPYGVNVTWAYLYTQYGTKYGFLPKFFGPSQRGWVGDNLLEKVDGALENHFTIIDPDVYLGAGIAEQFLIDQTSFSSEPIETYQFGRLILEYRRGKLISK